MAAVVTENGVQYKDAPKPSPKANEILIKVKAASLNRADLAVASGHRHGTVGGPGTIVGLECAGEVEAVGADVKDFKPGDRVMSSAAGGFAEYAVADSGRAHKIPANNMSYEQAACMAVAIQTMHNALVGAGRLKKGESVLIQGASSGVGLLGMQIAKHMGASIVMGTSTNEGRRGKLKDFGCDLALDTNDPKWPDKVKEATGGKGVDLIVDQVSSRHEPEHGGRGDPRPHRQCRPAGRHEGRVQLRPACAEAHRLYRRHLPHPQRPRRCAPSSRRPAPTCGRPSKRASCTCRSTRLSRCPRRPRRLRT